MNERQCCYRVLFAAASVLLLSAALTGSSVAGEEAASANVEIAGERAHFAQKFCGTSPERIRGYKERVRGAQQQASDFDRHWDAGWRKGEDEDSQMSALRLGNPADFASRVKADCERLKWLAENSVRARTKK